ncbi:nucleotide-diphospho-sugar transferase [Pararcticibacter amylolyticus]|uniref:Nucleotide-diphospho-sugar transferase n=2 Tax=Pararcticibacter amylolyticus TaxID=2173175 RepID=A0A2U2PI28_9SPHI|nr:nucleotide-diphospho-sugar transferase [Pararcticibacter amylolyticus]
MALHQVSSPVLFLIFNRPDTTSLVFEKIREARPSRLYIAADGPRNDSELLVCNETRKIIERIDWPCKFETLFRNKNLGCKNAVSSAIDWFFSKESEGIILEDDCLPSNEFFLFCDILLERYRDDSRIAQIAGCNFQKNKNHADASYYFSRNVEVWGWASWRRVWNNYDPDLIRYEDTEANKYLAEIFTDPMLFKEYSKLFQQLKKGEINTWDYQLKFISLFNNWLCIIPNSNLVTNIGFESDATHTTSPNSKFSNIPLEPLRMPIKHPIYILPSKEADDHIQDLEFDIEKKNKKLNKRLKRWLKKLMG